MVEKNWFLATNSNFLIPISLHLEAVMDCKDKGIIECLWQKLNSFVLGKGNEQHIFTSWMDPWGWIWIPCRYFENLVPKKGFGFENNTMWLKLTKVVFVKYHFQQQEVQRKNYFVKLLKPKIYFVELLIELLVFNLLFNLSKVISFYFLPHGIIFLLKLSSLNLKIFLNLPLKPILLINYRGSLVKGYCVLVV